MKEDIAQTLTPRQHLVRLLDRVPRAVMTGSHGTVVAYKKWLDGARKKAANKKTTEAEISALLSHYNALNKEVLL